MSCAEFLRGAPKVARQEGAMQRGGMTFAQNLRYRAVKIYANATKGALSVAMLAAPKWRESLPSEAPPRRVAPTAQRIPRILWQTNYAQRVTPQLYCCFRFNRAVAPSYDYRFCDDEACDRFVVEHYPGRVARAFQRLRIGAARADFWRILVLLKHGGVYMDIDGNFVDDPDKFIPADAEHVFIATDDGAVTNYFMASAPGNPALQEMCDEIVRNIEEDNLTSIFHMTGPTVIDRIVKARGIIPRSHRTASIQGQFTNKKGQYADKPAGRWDVAEKIGPILSNDP